VALSSHDNIHQKDVNVSKKSCYDCGLHVNCKNQVFPRGTFYPLIYVIGEAPGVEEDEQGKPFVGASGKYMNSVMGDLELGEGKCRIFNMVRCRPEGNRNPTDDEISACSKYLIADIKKTLPEVIVTVGAVSTKYILGAKYTSITKVRGQVYKVEIGGKEFLVVPTFHPSFVLRKGGKGEVANQFHSDFKKALEVANNLDIGIDNNEDNVEVDKDADLYNKETVLIKNSRDLEDFIGSYANETIKMSFDYETNSRLPLAEDSKVVGVGLAFSKDVGGYIVRESLDYKMDDAEWHKIVGRLVELLDEYTVIVHNMPFEIPFTVKEFGYYLTNIEDTLVKSRLLSGGDGGDGLVNQCMERLGYPKWDVVVHNYVIGCESIISSLLPPASGKNRSEYLYLKNKSIDDLYRYMTTLGKLDNRQKALKEGLLLVINVTSEYYTGDDYEYIMKLIKEHLLALVDVRYSGNFSYGWIPLNIIYKYGCYDAIGTYHLNDILDGEIDRLSNKMNLNLCEGYNNMIKHFKVGTRMEINGIYWDDDIAEDEKKSYEVMIHDAMLGMLNTGLVDDYLYYNNKNGKYMNDYIYNYRLGDVMHHYGNIHSINKTHIVTDRAKLKYNQLAGEMGSDYCESIKSDFVQYLKDIIVNADSYGDTKDIFNPNTSTDDFKKFLSGILIDDDVKVSNFVGGLQNVMLEKDFVKDLQNNEYNSDEIAMFNAIGNISQKVQDGHIDELEATRGIFNYVKNFLDGNNVITSKRLQEIAKKSFSMGLEDLSEESIVGLHNDYVRMGVDVEDENTWNIQYHFLYNYRVYKKCVNLVSSYIDGTVGRRSVWVVNKDNLRSGKEVVLRKRRYDHNIAISSDEEYLLQPDFNICGTVTGRWRSGVHTIPSESSIKGIFTSRFLGGSIATPDLSQFEVRMLAAASDCKSLLSALSDGMDIHKFVASKIWRKSVDEVSSAERKFAKGAVFSIIYGSAPESFAQSYMHGDIDGARELFNNVFTSFPEIGDYIKNRHKELESEHRVKLYTNRYINIVPRSDKDSAINEAKRKAQNYPIQGAACFTGDTEVKLLNGTTKSFKELVDEYKDREFWVYSYDRSTGKVVPGRARDPRVTKIVNKLVYVTLDNGEVIKSTTDHLYMSRSGDYIKAENLKPGMSLMPLYTRLSGDTDEIPGYEMIQDPDDSVWRFTHRRVTSALEFSIPPRSVRHHKDYNKLNNDPDNLEIMDFIEHKYCHGDLHSEYMKNYWRDNYDYMCSTRNMIVHSYMWDSDDPKWVEWRRRKKEQLSKIGKDLFSQDWFRLVIRKGLFDKLFNDPLKYDEWRSKISETIRNNDTLIKTLSETMSNKNRRRKEEYPQWDENQKKAVSKATSERNSSEVGMISTRKGRVLSFLRSMLEIFDEDDIKEDNYDILRDQVPRKRKATLSNIKKYFGSLDEALKEAKNSASYYNHKVVDVQVVNVEDTPVYDITVEDYHNFALSSGVFVHNSDLCGVMCYELDAYISDNDYLSKVFIFIQDSVGVDIYPTELFQVCEKVVPLLNEYPGEQFGVPAKADLTIGKSMGEEVEASNIDVNSRYTRGSIVLEGYSDYIQSLIDNWRSIYTSVSVDSLPVNDNGDYKETIYTPRSDLFIVKKVINRHYGTYRDLVKVKVTIDV